MYRLKLVNDDSDSPFFFVSAGEEATKNEQDALLFDDFYRAQARADRLLPMFREFEIRVEVA